MCRAYIAVSPFHGQCSFFTNPLNLLVEVFTQVIPTLFNNLACMLCVPGDLLLFIVIFAFCSYSLEGSFISSSSISGVFVVSYSFSSSSLCRSSSQCNSHLLKFSRFHVIKFPSLRLDILILGLQLILISLILYRIFEFYLTPTVFPHLSTVSHNNFSSALPFFFMNILFYIHNLLYSYSTCPSILFCCISQYTLFLFWVALSHFSSKHCYHLSEFVLPVVLSATLSMLPVRKFQVLLIFQLCWVYIDGSAIRFNILLA